LRRHLRRRLGWKRKSQLCICWRNHTIGSIELQHVLQLVWLHHHQHLRDCHLWYNWCISFCFGAFQGCLWFLSMLDWSSFPSNEIRVHVCVSDVLTNVARTFFTSCMQVHCSFLFSGIIRFLMQELLALAGLSRCRVWKVTVEEFYSWQRLHSFSFRNRFLDMNRFFSFLGKSKVVQG